MAAVDAGTAGRPADRLADHAPSRRTGRMRGRRNAIGAVVAQFSQAAASFLLSVQAFRYSGSDGVGKFALVYGIVILATAVVSGMVGDSLTALDRERPDVRAGLQRWALIAIAAVAVGMFAGSLLAGTLGPGTSILFAATGVAFVLEDIVRRLLMATMRFDGLVLVDVTALVVSVGYVFVAHAVDDDITIVTMLLGVLIGQLAGLAAGTVVLPRKERWVATGTPAAMRTVWQYGSWRSLQLMSRPAMMAVVRGALAASVGLTLFGRLEAARVYVAPAMLMVSGAASFLFASYAKERSAPLTTLLGRADRAVGTMIALTSLAGLLATLLSGQLGEFLSDENGDLSRVAVAGWSAYTAATAAVTPYGSLAAIRGRQLAVLGIRIGESVVTIAAVLVMIWIDTSIWVVPFAMAAVALLSGVALRWGLLPALIAAERATADDPDPVTSSRAVHISTTAE